MEVVQISETQPKRYSYSALSAFENCPMQFWFKYIQKQRADEQTLPLSLGTLLHKGKELVSKALMAGEEPDYALIKQYMFDGYEGADKATGKTETLIGIHEIRKQFETEWMTRDEKSGLTYEQKLDTFLLHLPDEANDEVWRTIASEVNFEVPFEDVVLFGIIDNISENVDTGELMVKDYKSSKKLYSDKDIKAPLQMVVYNLAVESMFPNRKIACNLYDFILLGETQEAGTKGWMERGKKKLSKIIGEIRECEASGTWKPSPTPLCHWCSYCRSNPHADTKTKGLCPYNSLWTPQNKTFATNEQFTGKMPQIVAEFVI